MVSHTCVFTCRQTGLLVVGDAKSPRLDSIQRSLQLSGAKYERLQAKALRDKFPMMTFDDTFGGVYDPWGGILRADKCLTAFQVKTDYHCLLLNPNIQQLV